jgi:hypothetical protein
LQAPLGFSFIEVAQSNQFLHLLSAALILAPFQPQMDCPVAPAKRPKACADNPSLARKLLSLLAVKRV